MSFERSPIAPLRHRNFRLLWLGACASLLGDGIYLVALAWQAYTLTERPAGLALLGVCATVPQLLALMAGGVISDRFDRRQVLLLADVARAVAVGTVTTLVLAGHVRMWHLAVLGIIYGAGAGFAAPAFDAILPSLVPDRELEQANALEQFLRPAMLRLAGPAIGGVIIAAGGAGLAFLIDAATFVISAACLVLMGGDVRHEGEDTSDTDDRGTLLGDAVAGIRFVRQRVWLWGTFAAATVAYLMFIGPIEVLLPYLVRVNLHGSATDLGLVLGSGGVGALAAAALVGITGLPRRQLTFMYITWTLATLSIAGYGIAQSRWHLVAVCFAFNALEAAGTIAWATTKQRLVPPEMLGRVSSLDWFISIAGLPLSFALTAPAAHLLGARETMIGAGVLGAAVTLAALFIPGMRDVDGAAKPMVRIPEDVRTA
jgi:MFS family permease